MRIYGVDISLLYTSLLSITLKFELALAHVHRFYCPHVASLLIQ